MPSIRCKPSAIISVGTVTFVAILSPVYRAEAIGLGLASCVELVGDPAQSEHTGVGETLSQNLKTGPVIRMRMRENDPIDGLAQPLHV